MAQVSSPGGLAIGSPSLQAALSHPAVRRLADILKIDLSDDAQLQSVVALANKTSTIATAIRAPPVSRVATFDSSLVAMQTQTVTPVQIAKALKAYREIASM